MRAQKQYCATDPTGTLGCLPDSLANGEVNLNAAQSTIASSVQGFNSAFAGTRLAGLGNALGLYDLSTAPTLPAIDGYHLANVREYSKADPAHALATFRAARRRTLDAIERLEAADLERRAVFEGYGLVTVRGLIHYLCSHDQQHLAGLQWLLGKMEAP